jgi:hypothetical protein
MRRLPSRSRAAPMLSEREHLLGQATGVLEHPIYLHYM